MTAVISRARSGMTMSWLLRVPSRSLGRSRFCRGRGGAFLFGRSLRDDLLLTEADGVLAAELVEIGVLDVGGHRPVFVKFDGDGSEGVALLHGIHLRAGGHFVRLVGVRRAR